MSFEALTKKMLITVAATLMVFEAGAENYSNMRLEVYFDSDADPMITIPMPWGKEVFIVDTGSNADLHITEDFIKHMGKGIRRNGSIKSMDISGKVEQLRAFDIPLIEIGDVRFEGLRAVELTPWGVNAAQNFEPLNDTENMVLGRRFFKDKIVLFDYNRGYAEIISDEVKKTYVDKFKFKSLQTIESPEGIVLEIPSHKRVLRFIVDTASTISVVQKDRIRGLKNIIPCSELLKGLENTNCEATSIPLSQGNSEREIKVMMIDNNFGDLEADGIVGADFLFQGRLLIDFSNAQVYIE